MKTTIKRLVLCALSVFFVLTLGAQTKTENISWVLAASPLTLESDGQENPILQAASKLIPELLLEECAVFTQRVISPHESAQRALYKLHIEANGLYKDLTAKIQARDAVLLSPKNTSPSAIQKALEKEEKNMAETQKQITANAEKAEKILAAVSGSPADRMPLALYKNDAASLYEKKNPAANAFADGISGLLTGTISLRGSFVSVTVELTVYPENKLVAVASDAGGVNDAGMIAASLARQLVPLILNDEPSILHVRIEPPEAASGALVHVNGLQYKLSDGITIPAGRHALYVTSEGYKSAQMTYEFAGSGEYAVTAYLKPVETVEIMFTSPEMAGNLFLQAVPRGGIPVETGVSGDSLLGEFLSDSGQSTFFQFTLPDMRRYSAASLSANIIPNKGNVADSIEKSRKSMYTTYGALLLSLPFSYLSYGAFVNAHNAWAIGVGSESQRSYWKTTSDITMGISIGCGVLFAVQLGRYLFTANKVIPKQIRVNSVKIDF